MPHGPSEQFQTAFKALQAQGPLKTWSLIVTLFGDIAPTGDVALESQLMQQICAPFGVKPEAFRVALHRLRKEGWIVAEMHGRRSAYRLTELGQAATKEASERIYRGACAAPEAWHLALVQDPNEACEEGFLRVAGNILVCAEVPKTSAEKLTVTSAYCAVPSWMKAALTSRELAEQFAEYEAVISQITPPENPAESLSLRMLVLHYWRRLLLRQPDLPEVLLGPDWPGYGARQRSQMLFETLVQPEAQDLAAFFEGENA